MSTRVAVILRGGVALLALTAACAVPRAETGLPAYEPRPLGGQLAVASFVIPAGMVLSYDSDLVIDSAGDIVIGGGLQGVLGSGEQALDGADLTLRSRTRIVISGSLVGAPGRSGRVNDATLRLLGLRPGLHALDPEQVDGRLRAHLAEHGADGVEAAIFDGGAGGSIRLIAPEIVVEVIRGGAGGDAGPGGNGGTGGDVLSTPVCVKWRDASPGIFGGAAGIAGDGVQGLRDGRGGSGGGGGSALGGALAFDG